MTGDNNRICSEMVTSDTNILRGIDREVLSEYQLPWAN